MAHPESGGAAVGPAAGSGSVARVPGQLLLHPLALLSLVVLVVNDHYLKDRVGGTVTGKLSDVAGLFFFPLVLLALLEWARWARRRRPWTASLADARGTVAVTAAGFAAIKLIPAAGAAYVGVIGGLRWMGESVAGLVTGDGASSLVSVHLSPDASDLLTLPVLVVSYLVAAGEGARAHG
jgi:hypothetical protein